VSCYEKFKNKYGRSKGNPPLIEIIRAMTDDKDYYHIVSQGHKIFILSYLKSDGLIQETVSFGCNIANGVIILNKNNEEQIAYQVNYNGFPYSINATYVLKWHSIGIQQAYKAISDEYWGVKRYNEESRKADMAQIIYTGKVVVMNTYPNMSTYYKNNKLGYGKISEHTYEIREKKNNNVRVDMIIYNRPRKIKNASFLEACESIKINRQDLYRNNFYKILKMDIPPTEITKKIKIMEYKKMLLPK
jgi:hypothetical protein